MSPTVLIRYGELALKSPPVRREFERTLERNLLGQFRRRVSCRLRADHGHLYLSAEEGSDALRLARRVFGVTSVSEVVETRADPAEIERTLLPLAEPRLTPGSRFAVRARRTGTHPFSSQELARDLGSAVLARWPDRGLRVDLESPDVELGVEVRGPRAYLSLDRRDGPGGLPLGVGGRLAALVDGPRGALGTFLMMKRGCRCAVATTPAGEPFVRETLARFDPGMRIEAAGEPTEAAVRRLVEEERTDGVILPLSVEDFPSTRAGWGDVVLFSPTVGLSDEEVQARWAAVEGLLA